MNAHPQGYTSVLIVDEDFAIRDTLCTLLCGAGYTVAQALSESHALDYLHEALSPHIVLLDFFLPFANRSVVLHAAEHDDTLRRHCYLLVTAAEIGSLPEDERRLIGAVCIEVVPKPVDASLVAAVARAAAQLRATQNDNDNRSAS